MSDSRTVFIALLAAATWLVGAVPATAQDTRIVTFEDALTIALEQNTTLRQAQNATALSALGVDSARAQFLPDLRLSSSTSQSWSDGANRLRDSQSPDAVRASGSARTTSLGVDSGVTVFNGFANTASLASARASNAASRGELERARETVVFAVASQFLALVTQQEQLRVQRENLSAQAALEQQIQTYVNAGARTIADLYQQQATVASARLAVVRGERALELASIDLIRTLMLDPGGTYEFVPPTVRTVDRAYSIEGLETLVDRAWETRADLDAVEARLAAAEQDIRLARSGRWPSVTLGVGYDSSYSTAREGSFSNQIDDRRGGSVGLSVSVPIFDRHATGIATRRAEVQADNARIALDALRQDVGAQVRTAVLDLGSAGEQLAAALAQQRAAEQALEVSRQRYAVGAATLVELTQSQAAFVEASSALVTARYEVEFQRRLLDYYVGGLDEEAVSFD